MSISAAMADPLAGYLTPKQVIIRFAIVMGLVVVSSIFIFIALMIVKRAKMPKVGKYEPIKKTPLKTPETVVESIDFYINKNRL